MQNDSQPQVLIAGAGIIGIACAHYLSRAGLRITVIDQGQIGAACSHANCGYVCPSHVLPLTEPGAIRMAMKSLFKPQAPFRVKPRFDPKLARWMWKFARRCTHRRMLEAGHSLQAILDSSMREFRRLIEDEHLACQWRNSGLLYVLLSADGMKFFAETDQLLTDKFGVQARRIEGADLSQFDPALKTGLAGAFYYPEDAMLRPDLLCRNWAAKLREEGVHFVEDCRLEQVRKARGQITGLTTTRGELKADHYVFATGAWSGKLARALDCPIPIQPGKGYSLTMRRPELCPTVPMLFPEHKIGVTPFDDGYRLGSMMEFAGFDKSISPKRIDQLRRSAEPYLREPYTDAEKQEWYGWRPMTWDSLPIIGPTPELGNAWLATGHNMLGLSLAPATGRLLAEMIREEKTHIDAEAFQVNRF